MRKNRRLRALGVVALGAAAIVMVRVARDPLVPIKNETPNVMTVSGDGMVSIDKSVVSREDIQTFISNSPAGVTVTASSMPEPASMLLLATGFFGISIGARRWTTPRS